MKVYPFKIRARIIFIAFFCFIGRGQANTNNMEGVISSPKIQAKFVNQTGAIASVMAIASQIEVICGIVDRYEIEDESSNSSSTEDFDRIKLVKNENGTVVYECRNEQLSQLAIKKVYSFETSGTALLKDVTLTNIGEKGFFVKHFTDAKVSASFRERAFYFQPQKGNRRAIKLAKDVTSFIQLGSDQAERQRMVMVAPDINVGVVHQRHRIDGRFTLPRCGNNFTLYGGWTKEGWRFSTAAFYLKPGQSRSVQLRLEINNGDLMGHYIRYAQLPELVDSLFNYRVPDWVSELDAYIDGMGVLLPGRLSEESQKIMGKTEDWWQFFRDEKLKLCLRQGSFRLHNGDFPIGDSYTIHHEDGKTNVIDMQDVLNKSKFIRRNLPGIKLGEYAMLSWIDVASEFYKDNPEAVIYRKDGQFDYEGREGHPRPSDIGKGPTVLREFGAPGAIDVTAELIEKRLEKMNYDYFYTDGGLNGNCRMNWKLKQVTQPYVWYDAFQAIRNRIRKANNNAVILANADISPIVELNYWEYYHWKRKNYDWRHVAVSLPIAKTMVRPGALIMLHKWNNAWASKLVTEGQAQISDKQYAGYVLGLGLLPMFDNLTLAMARQRLPIVRAAKETRGSIMADADVRPAWWRHVKPIGVEAYTLRKGNFGLIPVMSRQKEDKLENISFDTEPLGLAADSALYLWCNSYLPPQGDPLKSDKPYNKVYEVKVLKGEKTLPKRAELMLNLPGAGESLRETTEGGPLQLVVASSVPVWVYSADGKRFQTALPEQDGVAIYAAPSKTDELHLSANSEKDTAEVFLPFSLLGGKPEQIQIDYKEVSTSSGSWDEEAGVLLTVPKGSHIISIKMK